MHGHFVKVVILLPFRGAIYLQISLDPDVGRTKRLLIF
jgi:hypothetical protein